MFEQFTIENWTENDYNTLIEFLIENKDVEYRNFHKGLVPNVNDGYIIGIRIPFLKSLGKAINKGNARSFLSFVQDNYFEESMLYGIVLGRIKAKDYDEYCELYHSFVKRINNWSVCDINAGKNVDFKKYKKQYFAYIERYIYSDDPWYIRYGLITMFNYKRDHEYLEEILKRIKDINSDYYYVQMAQAWLLAELYIFYSEEIHNFLLQNYISRDVLKMTVRKIRDSYRIDDEDKNKAKLLLQ